MNKLKSLLIIGLLTFGITTSFATENPKINNEGKVKIDVELYNKMDATMQTKALNLQTRMNEIFELDKSEMSRTERKEVRSELKSLKMDMKAINKHSGGHTVFISTGGLIIIILLLIIIF